MAEQRKNWENGPDRFFNQTNEQLLAQMNAYKEAGDEGNYQKLRRKIIEKNIALAKDAARKFIPPKGLEYEDLESYAYEGLIKAIEKYDVESNVKLSTFATFYIKGYVMTWLRRFFGQKGAKSNRFWEIAKAQKDDKKRETYLKRLLSERYQIVADILKKNNGSPPTKEEVYREIENEIEQEIRLYEAAVISSPSIDDPDIRSFIGTDQMQREKNSFLADPIDLANNLILAQQIEKALNTLSDRERQILFLRFNEREPKTLTQIAAILGVTRQRISQLEKRALATLAKSTEHNLADFLEDIKP